MTELHLVPAADPSSTQVLSLLPVQQDVSHFGLALLNFADLSVRGEASVSWSPFLNGIEPAPVSSATLCGEPVVLFARPSTALPRAPQELVLGRLAAGSLNDEIILARAKGFFDVSIAALKSGALVSYVADKRTWARTVRCRNR
jgi:hypothetical protein